MKRLIIFFSMVMLTGLLSAGCGYTTSSLLPPDTKTIHVNNFTNDIDFTGQVSNRRMSYSYRPGMENRITRKVIDEFIFDRNLDLASKSDADLVLSGKLIDFRQFPLSYSDGDDVEEFRMEIYVDIELFNEGTGEKMWQEKGFMGYTTYTVSGENSKTEASAEKDAVEDLSQRIIERVVEHW